MKKQKEFKEEKLEKDTKEVKMGLFGKGRGLLGISINTERSILNPIGFLFIVFGVYLFLVASQILPLTSRFDFLSDIRIQFITSLVLIILGVILNGKTRNIFQ